MCWKTLLCFLNLFPLKYTNSKYTNFGWTELSHPSLLFFNEAFCSVIRWKGEQYLQDLICRYNIMRNLTQIYVPACKATIRIFICSRKHTPKVTFHFLNKQQPNLEAIEVKEARHLCIDKFYLMMLFLGPGNERQKNNMFLSGIPKVCNGYYLCCWVKINIPDMQSKRSFLIF